MVKLIIAIIIAIFAVFFIGLNLSNLCTLSVVFYTFQNVPIYLVVLIAFLLGVVITIPFCLIDRQKVFRSKKQKEELKNQKAQKKKNANSTEETQKAEENKTNV